MLRNSGYSRLRTAVAIAALGASAGMAEAQVPASPDTELPEVTVTTDADASAPKAKRSKAPAAAQQSSTPPNSNSGTPSGGDTSDIAVSPTGTPQPVDQIGSSVTVITSKEIEAQQRRTLPDVLKSVPGLNVVQTGGPGGQTSIFMRGTNSNHTKVLIDGIDVSDPSTPNRSFDYGQMLAMDIDRVEILRGPQSGLYGADALGGVILIYTKKGKGPPQVTGMVEGGSFGTFNQAATVSGGSDRYNYSVNISHYRADDIPVTPLDILVPGVPRFPNRYDNWSYSAKLGVDVTKDVTVNLVTRYIDSKLDSTSSLYSLDPLVQDGDSVFTRGEVVWRTLGGNLTNYFGVNYTNSQRSYTGITFGDSYFEGDRIKYDWRSVFNIAPGYTLVTGADHQNEQLDTTSLSAEEWNNGVFAELQSEFIRNWFVVSNVRFDDNEKFGGHTTWRVASAYVIEGTGTKLKGSVGTAFKAPTLDQRYHDYPDPYYPFFANPDLKPELNTGFDVGFEQAILNGHAQFGATYFRNDISDLIDSGYDPVKGHLTYINVGKARTEGVEAFVSADITQDVRVRADYTYTEATDADTGVWLKRRPRNKASFNVGWTPTEKLLLTGSVLFYGDSLDIDRVNFRNVILPSFTVVNVAADYKLTDNMSVYGRIDNLFNEHYEIPDGFLGTGIGVFGGVRFTN